MRTEEDEVRAQREHLVDARADLARALDELAQAAKDAARTARTKRGRPDLPRVYAARRAVEAAEEALDFAQLDLHTALGGDA